MSLLWLGSVSWQQYTHRNRGDFSGPLAVNYIFKVKAAFTLAVLPPTTTAASQHSLRGFRSDANVVWTGPLTKKWGWKSTKQGLFPPETTTYQPASNWVLSSMAFKCIMGCNGRCTCRKAGLQCSTRQRYPFIVRDNLSLTHQSVTKDLRVLTASNSNIR